MDVRGSSFTHIWMDLAVEKVRFLLTPSIKVTNPEKYDITNLVLCLLQTPQESHGYGCRRLLDLI